LYLQNVDFTRFDSTMVIYITVCNYMGGHDAIPLSFNRLIACSVLLRILCEGVLIVDFMV
jgi:hypothetical protein